MVRVHLLLVMLVHTRVGMILHRFRRKCPTVPCPHTRGDDPTVQIKNIKEISLSPHAWG